MSRSPGKIAKRYARALFESYDPSKLEEIAAALQDLANAWTSNESLRTALVNPAVPLSERQSIVEDIARRAGNNDQFLINFSCLLLENGRIASLPEVATGFALLLDLLKKRLALEVTSAFDIDGGEREQILDQVRRDFGGLASIEWHVDKEIIGGLRIQAGDLLLDGSVSGALADLRTSLIN
jgi:F-type H+-transporting ATPase subunit delta